MTDLKKQKVSITDASPLGNDLLVGAEAIALELNWRRKDGAPHKRRVYHLAEKGGFPIHNVPGLGLCARKSALRLFFERLNDLAPLVGDD